MYDLLMKRGRLPVLVALICLGSFVYAVPPRGKTSFPSRVTRAESPDHRYAIINVENQEEPRHTLFLEDEREKTRRKLMDYGRSVEVLWNPNSRYFIVNDYAGSNVAECWLFNAEAEGTPVRLSDAVIAKIKNPRELASVQNNFHLYFAASEWRDRNTALIEVWGQGDADPKGFRHIYTYKINP